MFKNKIIEILDTINNNKYYLKTALGQEEVVSIDCTKELVVIETKAADVEADGTYTEVIYPELIKVINKDVREQYRPIAKAGSLSILGGIDLLFASNPEWKKDQDTAIQVVDSFILGAKTGFSLDEKHPAMIQARSTATKRAKVLN